MESQYPGEERHVVPLVKMCSQCAFKPNSVQNVDFATNVKLDDALKNHNYFICHLHADDNNNQHLCGGWINFMNTDIDTRIAPPSDKAGDV